MSGELNTLENAIVILLACLKPCFTHAQQVYLPLDYSSSELYGTVVRPLMAGCKSKPFNKKRR